ncbi:MAG: hypothetical protein ABWZ66_00515 [Pyrinomonadaceae bacterium]
MPNVRQLTSVEKQTLRQSAEIREFILTFYLLQAKLIKHIRDDSTSAKDAENRAANVTNRMKTAMQNLNIAITPTTAAAAYTAARAEFDLRCAPPRVWDPITETCV